MVKVLFVCLGNICRSPMAEAIMRHLANEQDLDIKVDSCGMSGYHTGDIPHMSARRELDINGVSHDGIFSRRFTMSDFDQFDYIVAMDDSNVSDIKSYKNDAKVYKLTDFCENFKETEVPDPYYYGGFSFTYDILLDGCKGIIKHIQAVS